MTGGNVTNKDVPWYLLHQVVEAVDGKMILKTVVDSRGNETKQIVITYSDTTNNNDTQDSSNLQ